MTYTRADKQTNTLSAILRTSPGVEVMNRQRLRGIVKLHRAVGDAFCHAVLTTYITSRLVPHELSDRVDREPVPRQHSRRRFVSLFCSFLRLLGKTVDIYH